MGQSGWSRRRWALASFFCLLGGCEDPRRPLDGGGPLVLDANRDPVMTGDQCWRRERGGWHHSFGHCEAMTPTATIEGVWVTAFEESSFFPGARAKPDPRDLRRYTTGIELDNEAIFRAVGTSQDPASAEAFYLRFAGRRTRDPLSVDCYGSPYFVYVVDQLIEVRQLGEMQPFPPGWFEDLARNRPPVTVRRVHGGRWGELEAQAMEHCRPRAGADRLENQADALGNAAGE